MGYIVQLLTHIITYIINIFSLFSKKNQDSKTYVYLQQFEHSKSQND